MFVSKAWAGRVLDKEITERSGFLDFLRSGYIILADRGFDITDLCAMSYATVKIPSFLNGKNQLSTAETMETRKIAHVRIHVGEFDTNKYIV